MVRGNSIPYAAQDNLHEIGIHTDSQEFTNSNSQQNYSIPKEKKTQILRKTMFLIPKNTM